MQLACYITPRLLLPPLTGRRIACLMADKLLLLDEAQGDDDKAAPAEGRDK
jgi:hypothetical protein